MKTETLFSRNSDEWATPQGLFDELDREFHFNLDPCATAVNAKCIHYYTLADNGLEKPWGGYRVFCNPPYSDIARWVKKAYEEAQTKGTIVCLLIPARTDTRYFHDYILHRSEIRFLKGRIRFGDAQYNAPFPSMVVIFRGPETD